MKQIPLTQGKVALVDDADFMGLIRWKWFAQRVRKTEKFYAVRATARNATGRQDRIYMHRELALKAGVPQVDHQDNDGLNNQRYNLRPATVSQNQANRGKRLGTRSQFKGVTWYNRDSCWRASIRLWGRGILLGYFTNELAAAKAYDAAAKIHFGDFARLNLS